jgi:threonine/homoserine/homoserine lactone efflux protein
VPFDLPLPLRSLIIGFTIAMAVGPITLLVVRRTIDHGGVYGFVSGLGVAAADATYGAIAAFGLTALTALLVSAHTILGIVGGAVIVLIGLRTIATRPSGPAQETDRPGLLGAFASIYGLTMTNPMTIVSFAGLFAGLGLATSRVVDAATLTLGVFAGSAGWWLVLVGAVGWLRSRVTVRGLVWVNRVSGAIILVFAVVALASVLKPVG